MGLWNNKSEPEVDELAAEVTREPVDPYSAPELNAAMDRLRQLEWAMLTARRESEARDRDSQRN